jgi:hypothetical protein
MARIYAGQSALRITLKTFTDLEGIISAVIKYRKPDGATGEFCAGIADSGKGVIFHECLEGEIDLSGWCVLPKPNLPFFGQAYKGAQSMAACRACQ